MSNKTHRSRPLLPWLSHKPDGKEGRFLQIGNSLFVSDTPFKKLTAGAQMLYLFLAMESGGKREVEFSRTTAKKYGISKNAFTRQIRELESNGFVEVVMERSLSFKPTVYRFVYEWKKPVT